MRVAIIDMGTNTFNLLVVEVSDETHYQTLHNSKCFVKLGEGGIDKKFIAPDAWERGLKAIESHMNTISNFNADKVFAFATSATRDAENGASFVDEILKRFNLKVNVIGGEQEASLIYKGVKQAVDLGDNVNLILDIGGGSNEVILCNANQVFWKHSFNLGVQRLLNHFKPSDPITSEEVGRVELFLEQELQLLFSAVQKCKPIRLVGSSGSFDTYRSLLAHSGKLPLIKDKTIEIPLSSYKELHKTLIKSKKEERIAMPGMELIRVDFIVLASIFTSFIIEKLNIESIHQSNYALKEGALWEVLNEVKVS